mgnify:FL=1
MKNSAKNLLEFSIILGISTLVITYLVSTTSGRVAPFIPIISEMPFSEPEESIFSTGLGISLFATLLVIQVIYRKFEPLAKTLGENYVKANYWSRIIASIGSVCGIITVSFNWKEFPVIHGITAFTLFTSYLVTATFSYQLMKKNGMDDNLRKYAIIGGWIFYVMMAIFSVLDNLDMLEEKEDFFHRMDNPPNVDTERTTYLNLTAFCEWAMVFSFYLSLSTYRDFLKNEPI